MAVAALAAAAASPALAARRAPVAPCEVTTRGAAGERAERDTAPSLVIDINVPAYRLEARDGDSTWSFRVAVGTPRYPTPRGAFRVREIVWNPWWVPPASDWARDARVTPPGPENPMGRVKLRITDLVFVHGTPLESSVGSAASHACVRMTNADAITLARLVHRRATPEVPAAVLDSALADSTRPRRFVVSRTVPVTVRYDVAEVRRDSLWVYPDVYRLRRSPRADAMLALAAAGADTLRVKSAALDALLRDARRRAAGAALADLLGAQTPREVP